jgi:hypothetical protein
MSPNVALAFPDTLIQVPLRNYVGQSLQNYVLAEMRGADPFGCFDARKYQEADYRIHLGRDGAKWIVHGSDWNAFVGAPPSPLPSPKTINVFGAAFASITAIARIFAGFLPEQVVDATVNLLHWDAKARDVGRNIKTTESLGNIWFVGGGSVGSAVAYFLTLAGLNFEATIFDRDDVKIENLDRSPIFQSKDEGQSKAKVIARFLSARGVQARAEPIWLDESQGWKGRQQGTPDILVSAANERNVRYAIETQFPPVQVYGTTGLNWQASVFRHIPPQDPCSCCVFPPAGSASIKCATGLVTSTNTAGEGKQIDAALPFLSFAAGLMAAAEIAKLTVPDQRGSNRAFFTPCAEEVVFARGLRFRNGCICSDRNLKVHHAMISSSKYADLSKF